MIGRKVGGYEILDRIGRGGMGDVYRARDTRLDREVAIKTLPPEVAKDAARLARFEREAKLLASLDHPNIATVFGFEESDGEHFLALELVRGESLAERLSRGAVLLDELLPIARQIAAGLEAAHENGVVHRDLKPANIMVEDAGRVKLLDFGLAKGSEEGASPSADLSASPTLTAQMTQAGLILGTAAYMSPEQARGKAVDKRTDIWAFGCVLYEMLTGRPAFDGEDVPQILSGVLRLDPDLERLPPDTPPLLRRLVTWTLRKDPRERLRDIGDARLELGQLLREPDGEAGAFLPPARASRLRRVLLAGMATMLGVVLLALGAAGAWWLGNTKELPTEPVRRFEIPLASELTSTGNQTVAYSPDGKRIAYTASRQLWLHTLQSGASVPLPGEAQPRDPVFSPDSTQLAFWANDQVLRLPLDAAAPVLIGNHSRRPFGLYWADDGFVYAGLQGAGIVRYPAAGGEAEVLIRSEGSEQLHVTQLLPRGKWLLLTVADGPRSWREARIEARQVEGGERRILVERGRAARYLESGHLTWVTDGVLFAQPFDPDALEASGRPVPMVEGVRRSGGDTTGSAHYAVSARGDLVYAQGVTGPEDMYRMVLTGLDAEVALPFERRRYGQPRLSPDQQRIAATLTDETGSQIWLFEIDQISGLRLTSEGTNTDPVWSPDGRWVYFASDAGHDGDPDDLDIWRQRADLTGEPELVLGGPGVQIPGSISTSGDRLLFLSGQVVPFPFGVRGTTQIGVLSLQGDASPELLVETDAAVLHPRFSPDGRFFTYATTDPGPAPEVYVMELSTRRRHVVSADLGDSPHWSRDGERIVFHRAGAFFSARVETEPAFRSEPPQSLLSRAPNSDDAPWDLAADGRILQLTRSDDPGQIRRQRKVLLAVSHWLTELRSRAPVER